MNYAICRVGKLKSASKIRSVGNHNQRKMDVPNADPDRPQGRIYGSEKNLDQLVHERLEKTDCKTRKDSVLAMEIMLSASPSYFRPKNPLKWGTFEKEKLKSWVNTARDFLKEKYGDNLVAVDLHLDERTPHIHAIITPIEKKQRKKRGKDEYYEQNVLSAKTMFGKYQLRQLQTDYAKAVEPLGLVRGSPKSKSKHQTLKQYYGKLENILRQARNAAKRVISNNSKESETTLKSLERDYLVIKSELEQEKLKHAHSVLEGRENVNNVKSELSEITKQRDGLYGLLKGRNPKAAKNFENSLGL